MTRRRAPCAARRGGGGAHAVVELGQRRFDRAQQRFARSIELDTAPGPVEEVEAEPRFEVAASAGDRAVRRRNSRPWHAGWPGARQRGKREGSEGKANRAGKHS